MESTVLEPWRVLATKREDEVVYGFTCTCVDNYVVQQLKEFDVRALCEHVKIGKIPCDLDVLIFETDSVILRRRARLLLQQNSRMIMKPMPSQSPHPPSGDL
ncbi:unnamed protein product [Bursaphelenchus xylophilus]|uniref:(pine wood nematode) hypothetical protein n=1 Tax=Bursaphelenchus xylophilus TaxID=6326 RepID=A0A1I7SDG9_BURXY|nr:unnamed protein product [Bursaphelenchus xylophilus]CAG9131685.1 unnamed protein product [Bursaphelenchus xylophilus]